MGGGNSLEDVLAAAQRVRFLQIRMKETVDYEYADVWPDLRCIWAKWI